MKRLYLEACGIFSVYEFEEPRPGLSVLPPHDQGLFELMQNKDSDLMACCNCGNTIPENKTISSCEICSSSDWTKAII